MFFMDFYTIVLEISSLGDCFRDFLTIISGFSLSIPSGMPFLIISSLETFFRNIAKVPSFLSFLLLPPASSNLFFSGGIPTFYQEIYVGVSS